MKGVPWGESARYPPFIPSPDAHILFLLFDWEKDASGRYEHKTLINLMKSSSPWLLPGEGRQEQRAELELGSNLGSCVGGGGARASPTSLRDQRKQTMPGVRTGRVRPARHQFPLRVP